MKTTLTKPKRQTKESMVIDFCSQPKELEEVCKLGFNRSIVFNAITKGRLVNLRSGQHSKKGLYVDARNAPQMTPAPWFEALHSVWS